MNCKTLIWFFITFLLEKITTSPFEYSSSEYDITKTLQNSIQSMYPSIAELWIFLSRGDRKLQHTTFDIELQNTTNQYFCDLGSEFHESEKFNIFCDFINNKVVLTLSKFTAENKGWITENSTANKFCIHHKVYFTGNTVFESNGSFVDVSRNTTFHYEYIINEIIGAGELPRILEPSLIKDTRDKMVQHISTYVQKFAADLSNLSRTIFHSNYPDFLHSQQRHYYLISNIPLICFDLRNVTIKGLTNFFVLDTIDEQSPYTLWIRNISGEMFLDYGSEVEPAMKLNFAADYFTIKFDLSSSSINVEIRNYRVFQTTQNATLTDGHSAVIIRRIESAMASSLMPSMKVWWTSDQQSRKYNVEFLDAEMLIAMLQHSDFDTKKKALRKWIPFSDDYIVQKLRSSSRNRTETYHYRVSFPNVTINLISNISHAENLHCEMPNNWNITREIKAIPTASISSNNKTENDIRINFHVDFPSVNFSNSKSNISRENNHCELQLSNNEDVEVTLLPAKYSSWSKVSELKEKLDKALISISKQRIILNIKKVVCSSYEVCSKFSETVQDLFFHYIDKVLETCSLQRNKM